MTINTIGSLREHLQWAVELEHATLPPYLCALYSIKWGTNRECVEVIESVFLEEMLHLMLAANILNAVGGSPQIDYPGFIPQYPAYFPHSNQAFRISLAKFSRESLEAFMKLEKPEAHDAIPEDDHFETIGQFYQAIELALKNLCAKLGAERVFTGDPGRQIRAEVIRYGGSGRIIPVEDLDSALVALEEIVEQGEGLQHQEIWDGDRNMFHPDREEVGHYFRFNEIALGRSYQLGDSPSTGPSGEKFTVDWDAIHNMRANPRMDDYAQGSEIWKKMQNFNLIYSIILNFLHKCFNGQPRLLDTAVGTMYELKRQAIELMELPSGDGVTTVGPSFEYIAPEDRHQSP